MVDEIEPGQRRCPRDGHQLKVRSLRGVEVDLCLECDGVWLDRGEMARIAPGFDRRALSKPEHAFPRVHAVFRCPACGGHLLPRYYGARKERVEMDTCLQCGGLWLDVRDIKRLSTAAHTGVAESAAPPAAAAAAAGAPSATAEPAPVLLAPAEEQPAFIGFPRRAREWFVALTGMPLDISNPVLIVPYVTWSLILLNIFIFLYQVFLASDELAFVEAYSLITSRAHEGELYRYLTAMFLHASFFHLAGNLFFLYTFGTTSRIATGLFPTCCSTWPAVWWGAFFPPFSPSRARQMSQGSALRARSRACWGRTWSPFRAPAFS